ncbi:MAG TPA: TetR/AcrR family transcriptional regulator [Acidiferrobacterales bacterium]
METASLDTAPAGVDTRERILLAAEQLFAEAGFDVTSMSAIAARAGVSKANVFHHFTTKHDLYFAVLRAACRDSCAQLGALDDTQLPLAEGLERFARSHLGKMLEHEPVARLVLRELLSEGGARRGQELAEQVYGENFGRFVALLRRGQERGELRADVDPAMVATLLIGANVFFFEGRTVLRHFGEVDFADDPGRYSGMLVDLLLRGILPAGRGPGTPAPEKHPNPSDR